MTVAYQIGTPIDWTSGTGQFPVGGSITLPANPNRKWFYVQNQDTTDVSVQYVAQKASDGTTTTATFHLSVAASAGLAGGIEERTHSVITGQIVVTGTSTKKVVIVDLEAQ